MIETVGVAISGGILLTTTVSALLTPTLTLVESQRPLSPALSVALAVSVYVPLETDLVSHTKVYVVPETGVVICGLSGTVPLKNCTKATPHSVSPTTDVASVALADNVAVPDTVCAAANVAKMTRSTNTASTFTWPP